MRGQFGERLPGAYQAAARAMGVTSAELSKMMEDGELVAEDLLPKLSVELLKMANSGGQLQKAMNNTASAIARFQNNVIIANKTFNEAGFDKAVRDLFNTMSDAIMRAEPLWIALGKATEFAMFPLRAFFELLGVLGEDLGDYNKLLSEHEGLVKLAGLAMMALFKWSRKLLLVFLLIPAAMSGMAKWLDGEKLSWEEWAITIAGIVASLGAMVGILKKIKGLGSVIGAVAGATRGGAGKAATRATRSNTTGVLKSTSSLPSRLASNALMGTMFGPAGVAIGVGTALAQTEGYDNLLHRRDPNPNMFPAAPSTTNGDNELVLPNMGAPTVNQNSTKQSPRFTIPVFPDMPLNPYGGITDPTTLPFGNVMDRQGRTYNTTVQSPQIQITIEAGNNDVEEIGNMVEERLQGGLAYIFKEASLNQVVDEK